MAATPLDREAILKAVEELPPAEQLQVAQQIMKTIWQVAEYHGNRSRRPG